ncbi:MAG TPA: hypothetical protein VML58_19550 [Burkholderiaceae bacterium]|nr:hypothetical protein [Burkholderiaceae bacterium]
MLMHTRGLTELIVINVGLELGVIAPQVFTMLVLMALVSTVITSNERSRTHLRHSTDSEAVVRPCGGDCRVL